MIDYYLKFVDEAEANAVLYTDEQPNYANIDVLGVIYERPPVDAGEDYEPVALQGWHVNVRVVDDEDEYKLKLFKINPDPVTPVRVWA